MSETAWYLYCLSPAPVTPSAGVFPWTRHGVTAVVSEVPLDEFCGAAAEARLQDLAWVGPRACHHEAVVEEVMRQAPVAPARFATLFRSQESLNQFLAEHGQALAAFFAELGDQREWGVKGLRIRTPETAAPALAAGSPGTHYFQQRRMELASRKRLHLWLQQACQKAAAELCGHAGGFRERKVIEPADAESGAETIFNWAFLLRPAAEAEFSSAVDRLNREHSGRGLRFVRSGPWPPYSFAPALAPETQP